MLIKDYYGDGKCPECHQPIPDDAKAGEYCECDNHIFINTFNKVTTGFVIQSYATLPDGTHVCVGQEFLAGEVQYESTEYGDGLDVDTDNECYEPLDMIQPKATFPLNAVKWAYEDGVCPECGEDIPDDIADGQGCAYCTHVFYYARPDDG